MRRFLIPFLVLTLSTFSAFAGTGRLIIVNNDPAGIGFNDPTPVAPVGGNPGTTLGQQRLNVFQAAADRWTSMLDTNVDIFAEASFSPIPGCTATDAILGQAGPASWRRDFANAPKANVWYPIALANKFAGVDLVPTQADIVAQFNADVDNATCLGTISWYYGLDGQAGADTDLYVVVLHELAHGLGVSGASNAPTFRSNVPAITDTHTFDVKAGLRWDQMSEEQRRVSYTNTGNLVWDGPQVTLNASRFLQPVTVLTLNAPAALAGNYDIGTAAFGPAPNRGGLSGTVVRVADAVNADGPSATDGCTAFTNAAAVAGKVVMIDRGSCTFVQKARNAQAAGATAVIIGDRSESYSETNPATCLPPGMAGDADDVTIPVISIGINDANLLRTQFTANASISGFLRNDPSQLAGTTKEGFARLYAPCTSTAGSSLHHWDTVSSPNLLMEPSVNSDLLHGVDLTIYQLLDIGWSLPAKTGRRINKK